MIIVLESKSRWAPLLRRDLGELASLLHETRTLAAAREQWSQGRGNLLLIELTGESLSSQLCFLLEVARAEQPTCVISVGDRIYAKLAAEAGVVAHFAGLHRVESAVKLIRRHTLSHAEQLTASASRDLRTHWRDRLDWKLSAQSASHNPSIAQKTIAPKEEPS